eukprot:TRINITY_DN18166_c0_g1_i1.p3 TRINITY_DN18166_c0_g1~~TRINITY_DN18166_c0_g1_i1.p3  ORF type:complete len:138 (+),score=2.54 TRINITY_DN18166_c0_g1_i1:1173-1586(+)
MNDLTAAAVSADWANPLFFKCRDTGKVLRHCDTQGGFSDGTVRKVAGRSVAVGGSINCDTCTNVVVRVGGPQTAYRAELAGAITQAAIHPPLDNTIWTDCLGMIQAVRGKKPVLKNADLVTELKSALSRTGCSLEYV